MSKIASHIIKLRVRYCETDKMGVVWNGNYAAYFEIGRTELMRHNGMVYASLENEGYQLPLTESYIKYISPAFYDDEIEITSTLTMENKPTIKFDYQVHRHGQKLAEGFTVHSFLKMDIKRPVKPPQVFMDSIRKIIEKNGGELE